jgi:hypothetical protein
MPKPSAEIVEALFQQAADLVPEERGRFLDEQCGGNLDLRAAVEELLRFDAMSRGTSDFLQSPAADLRAERPRWADARPVSFGRYRIMRIHGEGGMGTVYEAQQDNPRRTVALKVIRPGRISPEHVKRFSHEAQILLSYMSPEQVAADPERLDGRSDVYTLGVILFELLAHRLSYDLEHLPVHEVARVI